MCRLCGCVRLCVSRLTLRFPSPNNIFTPPIQSSTRLVALRECRIAKVHWKFEHFHRACADIPSVELEGEPHHAINAVVLHLIEQVRREKERGREEKRRCHPLCTVRVFLCACVCLCCIACRRCILTHFNQPTASPFQYFAPLDKTGKMRHMLGHLFSLQSLLRVPRLLEEMEPAHEDLMQVRLI